MSLDYKITTGDIITIAVIVVGIIGYAIRLEAKMSYIDENGTKAVRVLMQEIVGLRIDLADLKATLREREQAERWRIQPK
jgi:hypothetical protein